MKHRSAAGLFLWSYGGLAALALIGRALELGPLIGLIDVILMPLLCAYVVLAAPRGTPMIRLAAIALAFSWLGDCASGLLLVKILFFLGAQIAYSTAFWPYRRRGLVSRPAPFVGYSLVILALIVVTASYAGRLAVPVAVYGIGLGVMALLATGVNRQVGIGAFLFLLSDIVLAAYFFVDPDLIPGSLTINTLLYLPAQLMIAVGVVRHAWASLGDPTRSLAAVRH